MTVLPPGQVSRLQRAALFASMRGPEPDRLDLQPRGQLDAERSRAPRAVRRVREDGRRGAARGHDVHRRERAELERRTGSRSSTPPAATPPRSRTSSSSPRLRRNQGGAADRHGDRRRARLARQRRHVAFADDVHPRPRPRLSRERPHGSDHGRLRRARVRRHLCAAAEHAAHRARRSPRATTRSSSRSSARRSTGRRSAARRCRSSTANTASRPTDPGRQGARLHRLGERRRRSTRRRRGATTRRHSASRSASRT